MHRFLFGCCLLLLAAHPARADQAAWLTKQQADTAHVVLTDQKEIRRFCEPCGDTVPTMETISSLALNSDQKGSWEILVNDRGIDLAYVYVQVKGTWVNLARLLNIRAKDVSPILPAAPVPLFSEDEHAHMLKTSPEFNAADERLNRAWKAVLPLVSNRKDRERLQAEQKDWLLARDKELQRLMVRHKYHMPVPEAVLSAGRVDRVKVFTYFADTRAAMLEQYGKGIKGEAVFSGVWSAGDPELGGDRRGLLLDDGLNIVAVCRSEGAKTPPQVQAVPSGMRVRISGPMSAPGVVRCVKNIRVEKLEPLPKKEPEPGKESLEHASVVGILCAMEGAEDPYVDLGGGECYSLPLNGDGAKDCRENAESGTLVAITGRLKTPARGLPYFDPTSPTTCTRLLPTH